MTELTGSTYKKHLLTKIRENRLKNDIAMLFDATWYAHKYLGDKNKKEFAWKHYLRVGASLGYDPNVFFDTDWYTNSYPSVATSGENPLIHFLRVGWRLGLDPNPQFSTSYYLSHNKDVRESRTNPLLHFINFGFLEGRHPYKSSWPPEFLPWNVASTFFSNREIENETKRVAVLIPVFNNWHMTERCLQSILKTQDAAQLDIYLINDKSTDNTKMQLARYPQVEVIEAPSNLGFTKACNFAFRQLTHYEYLYLLNNDTEVQENFLKNCLEIMDSNPRTGLVGSTLHFPDGTIQECGAIVWKDATVTEFGYGSKSNGIEFSFSRMVDFCAGAGILLRTKALEEVNFFDEMYAPAYYEDTDLAFSLRKFGYEIWVSHTSRIIHFGGITYGRDENSGVSELVEINRGKFLSKWEDTLLSFPESSTDNLVIFQNAMKFSDFGKPNCLICKSMDFSG